MLKRMREKIQALVSRKAELERGQAVVIVAAAGIALIAFIGLVTDVGLVYVQYGHLRRAVDAAAVAAAGQIRAGWIYTDSVTVATQYIQLHNLDPQNVQVAVPPISGGTAEYYHNVCCNPAVNPNPVCLDNFPNPPDNPQVPQDFEDVSMCADPPRKLVQVEADARVPLAFMNVLGFHEITLHSASEGEAATLDVALVIDASYSMAYETAGLVRGDEQDLLDCNADNSCQPMANVKYAARSFVDNLREPFDRVAIISFDKNVQTVLTMTNNIQDVAVPAIDDLQVYNEPSCHLAHDPPWDPELYWECTNTNLGGGVAHANNQFTDPNLRRDESVWVMIVLSDGAANASGAGVSVAGVEYCMEEGECCPLNTRQVPSTGTAPPYCRDWYGSTRHCTEDDPADCTWAGLEITAADPNERPVGWSYAGAGAASYDADDFARDMADFAALEFPKGNYIVIFSIGMGADVISKTTENGDPDAGEQLLRYLANVGDNGQWDATYTSISGSTEVVNGGAQADPCSGKAAGEDCGNYYYSPTDVNALNEVFTKIASRIFTRITQ